MPISLLQTLGMVLDKLVNKRLLPHLERESKLSTRQYAYRQRRETIDALKNFVAMVEENRRKSLHQAVVALDFSNAFNSAWKPYIQRRLRIAGVAKRLEGIYSDFLSGRPLKSEMLTRYTEKDRPQGSSLGRLSGTSLWRVGSRGWKELMNNGEMQ